MQCESADNRKYHQGRTKAQRPNLSEQRQLRLLRPTTNRALSPITRGYPSPATDIANTVASPLRAELGGDRAVLEEMTSNFALAIVGGVLCVLIVLIILYESLWIPLLVLASLPLAAAGGLLGLWFAGERLAMGSMIGFVLLIGLSAKNAILLADGINRGRGHPLASPRLTVLLAVKGRVRPILMTSFALAVGMLPTVFLRGAGSEFRAPMALSIICGIISSTALSFFALPALFGLFPGLAGKGHKTDARSN